MACALLINNEQLDLIACRSRFFIRSLLCSLSAHPASPPKASASSASFGQTAWAHWPNRPPLSRQRSSIEWTCKCIGVLSHCHITQQTCIQVCTHTHNCHQIHAMASLQGGSPDLFGSWCTSPWLAPMHALASFRGSNGSRA